jgi:hypothetical protein
MKSRDTIEELRRPGTMPLSLDSFMEERRERR